MSGCPDCGWSVCICDAQNEYIEEMNSRELRNLVDELLLEIVDLQKRLAAYETGAN